MSNDKKREDRAFEAFIVSQVRRERDIMNLNDLPELTPEQRAAMNKLPSDLIERLWNKVGEAEANGEEPCDELVDEELFAGMNRAEDMDEETRKKIEAARKKQIEELRKKRNDGNAES